MASSYLVKKADIYYFRHYIPIQVQQIFGKKEFLKTLKVTQKRLAIKISREIKIVFDAIMEKSQQVPSITWKEIRSAVDRAFDGIYQKYVKNVDLHGPGYKDGYDPFNYIPPEYEEYILLRDDSLEWGSVGDISTLADKIAQWSNLNAEKGTREHHLLCYYTVLGLYEHAHRKEHPAHYKNSILQDINESIKSIGSNFRYPESAEGLEGKQHINVHKLVDFYTTSYLAAHKNIRGAETGGEYDRLFKNITFPLIEIATGKNLDDIYLTDITQTVVNYYMESIVMVPSQFTKRFSKKFNLADALIYSKELENGKDVDLDKITIEHLRNKISTSTLNKKYVAKFSELLKHAVQLGYLEKNLLEKWWLKEKKYSTKTIRPFDYIELETIFSHRIFKDKHIEHKRNEYNGKIPYFKFWLPILGLYSGARENELAQLRVIDLKLDEICYFSITSSDDTTVKTASSIRNVPIHPMLIEIGILKYVEWLKRRNENYLFPELEGRLDKGAVVSKWFSYFIKYNCKIKNGVPNSIIGFHSFRNNFSDEYKQKGAQVYIAGETMGHKTQGMTYGVYGSRIKLKPMFESMKEYLTFDEVKFPWVTDSRYFLHQFPWE